MDSFGWVDEGTGYETFLAVAANHPVPVRIFTVEHGDEFSSLNTDVVLIASYERVEHDVPAGRILPIVQNQIMK